MRFELNTNRRAFLAMISFSEGTDRTPDPYRVCYGFKHTIRDLSEHPAVTGEWLGERLSDKQCIGAGYKPGCKSTAAGRYQLIKPTWVGVRNALKLPDFSPESQDQAALWLIKNRATMQWALNDIDEGHVGSAIAKCRRLWASFPEAGFDGQPTRSMTSLLAVYSKHDGVLAPPRMA